jgi:hypothetical protein
MTSERDRFQVQCQYERLLFRYHDNATPEPIAEALLLGQAYALLWVLNPRMMDGALCIQLLDDLDRMKKVYLETMSKPIDA